MKAKNHTAASNTCTTLDVPLSYLSIGLFILLLLLLFIRSGQYILRIVSEASIPIGQPPLPVADPCQPLPIGSNDEVSYRYAYDALDRKCDE